MIFQGLCRNVQSDEWQWFDDDKKVECDIDIDAFIKSIKAYPLILFYERCDDEEFNEENNLSEHLNKPIFICDIY